MHTELQYVRHNTHKHRGSVIGSLQRVVVIVTNKIVQNSVEILTPNSPIINTILSWCKPVLGDVFFRLYQRLSWRNTEIYADIYEKFNCFWHGETDNTLYVLWKANEGKILNLSLLYNCTKIWFNSITTKNSKIKFSHSSILNKIKHWTRLRTFRLIHI